MLAPSEHNHCLSTGMCASVAFVVAFTASPLPGDWIGISLLPECGRQRVWRNVVLCYISRQSNAWKKYVKPEWGPRGRCYESVVVATNTYSPVSCCLK